MSLAEILNRLRHRPRTDRDRDIPATRVELFPGFFVDHQDVFADIGCGGGANCVSAGKAGATVFAVDNEMPSLKHVELQMQGIAAKSFKAVLATSDSIPLPDGIASKIVCTEVLEHVGDASYFAGELARIGKPGGEYYISVPDKLSEVLMSVVAPQSYFEAPNHVRIFDRQQFKAIIEDAGLEVVESRFFGSYWSIWWMLRFASGTNYYPGSSDQPPEMIKKWEDAWAALNATPEGQIEAQKLDEAIPKSQIILARKPVA